MNLKDKDDLVLCPRCDGKGTIVCLFGTEVKCIICNGKGLLDIS